MHKLDNGLVIVDRDGIWSELRAERERFIALAIQEDTELLRRAYATVDEARRRPDERGRK